MIQRVWSNGPGTTKLEKRQSSKTFWVEGGGGKRNVVKMGAIIKRKYEVVVQLSVGKKRREIGIKQLYRERDEKKKKKKKKTATGEGRAQKEECSQQWLRKKEFGRCVGGWKGY